MECVLGGKKGLRVLVAPGGGAEFPARRKGLDHHSLARTLAMRPSYSNGKPQKTLVLAQKRGRKPHRHREVRLLLVASVLSVALGVAFLSWVLIALGWVLFEMARSRCGG